MPNLWGASPVSRDEGSRSYAARMSSRGSSRQRHRIFERVLSPVQTQVGRWATRDELASLQGTRAGSVGSAGRRSPACLLATTTGRCDQQSEKEQI